MTPPRTIGRILELAAGACPERAAVSLGEHVRSFGECERGANRLANALLEAGLRRGDRLLFWSPTSLDSFDVFFASQRLGVAFAPVNPAFSVDEMVPLVDYVQPRLLLADASLAALAEAVGSRCGVMVGTIGGNGPGVALDRLRIRASDHAPSLAEAVHEEDTHALFLTSGSTGAPKGVMVPHRASWNRAYGGNSRTAVSGGRGEVNMFPLFHWAGWHFTLCAWAQRRAIHLTTKADAPTLNAIIERWQPRYMYGIPAIWERLLDCPEFGRTPSLRTVMTGTYRVEPALLAALRERLPGIELTIGMGATELGMGTQIGDDDIDRKPYSVGLPAPGVEARLVDGELCARSDQMMSGYFRLPDQTSAALQDGWYHTGDLAEMDAEGYITITGRRREVIRSGGETISPAEVEAAMIGFPGIRDISVIGLPDRRWGEMVCAAVVLEPGQAAPDIRALRAFLEGRLAAFKHPRRIVTLPAIPRTSATGQIQRAKVRDSVSSLVFGSVDT